MCYRNAIAIALTLGALATASAAAPRTLFELAGARPEPGRLSNSVLVIIDAQREYTEGGLVLPGAAAAINTMAHLLARARQAGTPVIHIVHRGGGTLFNPEKAGFAIVSALKPVTNEVVIEKRRVSAFAETGLAEALMRTQRKNLIVVGFMTHNCVSSTVRSARDQGLMSTVVAKATATRDLPDGRGGVVTAAAVQETSLTALGDSMAVIVQDEDAIKD